MKENAGLCPKLKDTLNNCLDLGIFPDKFKLADISPTFKSNDSTWERNYRPVSVLNVISNFFAKLIFKQFINHIDRPLNQDLCGYRKNYSNLHALLSFI